MIILSWDNKISGRKNITKYELGIILRPDENNVDEFVIFDYPENKIKMQIFLEKELQFEVECLKKESTFLKEKVDLLKTF